MSSVCNCNVSLSNTGSPGCSPVMGVTRNEIMVPKFANDGTRNGIDPTDTLNSAYFTALINQSDDSKRWYPIGEMKNIATEKAESTFETFEDNTKVLIKEGIRNFSGLLLKGTTELMGKLKANRCSDFGVYLIDNNGSLIGTWSETDGKLYPIDIDENSFDVKLMFTTDTTIQKLMVTFDFDQAMRDEDLRMILSTEITGINLTTLKGLLDIFYKVVSCGQTELVIDVYAKYNSVINPYAVEGLVVADFVGSTSLVASRIRNVTDNADVTITSVVESATVPGRYTLAYTSQTVADVLQPFVKTNGKDASGFLTVQATVV